jgi:predicted transcriptional regulator of viral defense system
MAGISREQRWVFRLRDARSLIAERLTANVLKEKELEQLLAEGRGEWKLPRTLNLDFFADYLIKTKLLRRLVFKRQSESSAASYPAELKLYARPNVSLFDISLGLRPGSFLSHLSAAYVHGLTEVLPRTIYVNKEQAPKALNERPNKLVQESIDQAFAKPARRSGFAYTSDEVTLVLLAGQNSGNLDVVDVNAPDGNSYPTTSLERTLIDCVVRPSQAGGIHEVKNMYEAARDRVSLRRLRKVLDDLRFVYPYRQSIGFLLQKAGYLEQRYSMFKDPSFENDFYIDYAIPEGRREYSSEWRLYVPKGL